MLLGNHYSYASFHNGTTLRLLQTSPKNHIASIEKPADNLLIFWDRLLTPELEGTQVPAKTLFH